MTDREANRPVLDIFVEPTATVVAFVRQARWGLAAVMIALFVAVTASSTFVILQDEDLVADYAENALRQAPEGMTQERFEGVRESTLAALAMPGMAVILSLARAASVTVHLTVTWTLIACVVAAVAKDRSAFRRAILAAAGSLPIIILGSLVNLLLRLAFRDLSAVAGILPVLRPQGGASFASFTAASVDVFTVWYLSVVVLGFSASVPMKTKYASLLVSALWMAGLLISYYLGHSAGWTM